ncbi:MAG: hypothetical protein ACP5SI_05700 [Chloroflexia bacterium]
MSKRILGWLVVGCVIAFLLESCAGGSPTVASTGYDSYTSPNLGTSYPNALPAATQLALGTLLLEGTDQAVTPEQARTLLPLWQALQGRRIQNQAEVEATFRAIEQAMRREQLQAIAAMRLTTKDLATWLEEHAPLLPPVTPGAGGPYPEWRATLRAGQGWSGAGPWPSGTPGARRTPGSGGRVMGSLFPLLNALVEMLSQRAGS